MNRFSLWLGWRYIISRKQDPFVSFISRTSMVGIALGVMVLIVVLSVMNGFAQELQNRILGFVPHAIAYTKEPTTNWQPLADELETQPGVAGVAPLVTLEAMLVNQQTGDADFAILGGVLPEREERVSIINQVMQQGDIQLLQSAPFGIIIGEILANKLDVVVGESINVVVPDIDISLFGALPRIKQFQVVGIFSAQSEVDGRYGLVHMQDAAALKGLPEDAVESVRIRFDDIFVAPFLSYQLKGNIPSIYYTQDWTRSYGNLFASIQMEKRMVGLLLFFIVAVAAFNILATLVILVKDKQSQIAILRTMGASNGQVLLLFVLQGVLIWLIGSLVGLALGIPLALYINQVVSAIEVLFDTQFLSADTYFISYFPSALHINDLVVIVAVSFVLCVLATLYPALKATRIEPAAVLRAE